MSRARIHSGASGVGDVGAVDQRGRLQRGERLRHRMRQLRQRHGADRVVLAVTAPLEEAVEHAERAQAPRQAAAADAFAPPRGKKGAHVARLERQELLHVRQAVEMAGEEGEELGDVAFIGLGRVGRELALDAEIGEPVPDRLADVSASPYNQALRLLSAKLAIPDLGCERRPRAKVTMGA